ncbi:MerR family transcriptional regulator [Caulobacter sp. 1776]|uniref:MerR family transcriptional regulator n=1 Tax=Caulobacter sp. 1776 TaxID=3156420 RepID=UPI003397AC9F
MRASVTFLSPAEAARRLGISAKALRLYEARGLVRPGRTRAGWRAYGPDDLARASEVAAMRSLGLSLAAIERVFAGTTDALREALAVHETRLGIELAQAGRRLAKVRAVRRALVASDTTVLADLAALRSTPAAPLAAFDLPWPWGGERFELRDVRALNYVVGPLGSGKTRLARAIAEHAPNAAFLGLDRVETVNEEGAPELRRRIAASLAWLAEDGATPSVALTALVSGLERHAANVLVVDLVEHGLDEPTQHALIAHLRRRGADRPPLFLMTRSSAILDPAEATANEIALFCPANHAPPFSVDLTPAAKGFEALTSCLGPPETRARTEGMVATIPRRA